MVCILVLILIFFYYCHGQDVVEEIFQNETHPQEDIFSEGQVHHLIKVNRNEIWLLSY